MAHWWQRIGVKRRRRGVRPEPRPPAAGAGSVSRPGDDGHWSAEFVGLPGRTPFEMLRVYRMLRDAIPDLSDAVWTWKRLCQTGYDLEFHGTSSGVARRRAGRLLDALNQRVNSGDRGMEGLLDVLYDSLFTYGAAAAEIVLSRSRESIWDVVPVDVWTVRFRRGPRGLQAYQARGGESVALPMDRFVYLGMDRDGTNPYGRSMLRTLPAAVKMQQRLLEDMARATRNTGFAKLHLQYTPEARERGEAAGDYEKRIHANFETLRERAGGLEADQNLVTFDNVAVNMLRGEGRASGFYELHKAVEEQIITGTHLMPILLGRNYGTTETYGTAQFEILNRQVDAVNRGVKRLLERLYNFELALMWGEASVRVHMRNNRTVDALKAAQAREKDIGNALRLHEAGLLDADGVRAALNLPGGDP